MMCSIAVEIKIKCHIACNYSLMVAERVVRIDPCCGGWHFLGLVGHEASFIDKDSAPGLREAKADSRS